MMSMRLAVVTTVAMLAVACGGYCSSSPQPDTDARRRQRRRRAARLLPSRFRWAPKPSGKSLHARRSGRRRRHDGDMDEHRLDLPHVDLGRDWLELRNRGAGRQVLFCVPADGNVFVPCAIHPGMVGTGAFAERGTHVIDR